MCLFAIQIFSLMKCLFMSCPFSNQITCCLFLLLSIESSFYILDISSLLDMWLSNIFSKSVAFIFILLARPSVAQKFLIWMSCNLSIFFLWCRPKNSLSCYRSRTFFLFFFKFYRIVFYIQSLNMQSISCSFFLLICEIQVMVFVLLFLPVSVQLFQYYSLKSFSFLQ